MERIFIGLFAAATLLVVGAALFFGGESTPKTRPVAEPVEVPAEEDNGEPIQTADAARLARMLRAAEGTVAVVNLWATWCPPCLKEMPELAHFYQDWKDKGVTFISISADNPESLEEAVRPYVEEQQLPFRVYMMGEGMEKMEKSLKTYVSGALPTTLIYDHRGNMVKYHEGAVTQFTLEKWIDPYLKHVG